MSNDIIILVNISLGVNMAIQFKDGNTLFKKPKSFVEKVQALFQPRIRSPIPNEPLDRGIIDKFKDLFVPEFEEPIPAPTPDPFLEKGFTKAGGGYYKADGSGQTFINKAKIPSGVISQITSTPTSTPTLIPTPQIQPELFKPNETKFKFQDITNKVSKELGIKLQDYHLLRAGENQAENPEAINQNSDGTLDVGLYQVNVAADNRSEIDRLKNPEYNTRRAGEIWKQRSSVLKDPILAIASYNLGAGGAVLNPEDALKRAQWVYWKAGTEMPETEFTKDPLKYVRKRMDYYRKTGLFK